jgi:hypothetical protein
LDRAALEKVARQDAKEQRSQREGKNFGMDISIAQFFLASFASLPLGAQKQLAHCELTRIGLRARITRRWFFVVCALDLSNG